MNPKIILELQQEEIAELRIKAERYLVLLNKCQPYIEAWAKWEEKNGTLAGIIEKESGSLLEVLADLAVKESTRQVREALHSTQPAKSEIEGGESRKAFDNPLSTSEVILANTWKNSTNVINKDIE